MQALERLVQELDAQYERFSAGWPGPIDRERLGLPSPAPFLVPNYLNFPTTEHKEQFVAEVERFFDVALKCLVNGLKRRSEKAFRFSQRQPAGGKPSSSFYGRIKELGCPYKSVEYMMSPERRTSLNACVQLERFVENVFLPSEPTLSPLTPEESLALSILKELARLWDSFWRDPEFSKFGILLPSLLPALHGQSLDEKDVEAWIALLSKSDYFDAKALLEQLSRGFYKKHLEIDKEDSVLEHYAPEDAEQARRALGVWNRLVRKIGSEERIARDQELMIVFKDLVLMEWPHFSDVARAGCNTATCEPATTPVTF